VANEEVRRVRRCVVELHNRLLLHHLAKENASVVCSALVVHLVRVVGPVAHRNHLHRWLRAVNVASLQVFLVDETGFDLDWTFFLIYLLLYSLAQTPTSAKKVLRQEDPVVPVLADLQEPDPIVPHTLRKSVFDHH